MSSACLGEGIFKGFLVSILRNILQAAEFCIHGMATPGMKEYRLEAKASYRSRVSRFFYHAPTVHKEDICEDHFCMA